MSRLILSLLVLIFAGVGCSQSVHSNLDALGAGEKTVELPSPHVNDGNQSIFPITIHCPSGVTSIEVSGSVTKTIPCTSSDFTSNLDLSLLPDGPLTITLTPQPSHLAVNQTFNLKKDTTAPVITGLANDSTPTTAKFWNWSCNDSSPPCTYRYFISRSAIHVFSTELFSSAASASQLTGAGTYWLHVQAQDAVGNTSPVTTVSAVLNNVTPSLFYIQNPGATMTYTGTVDLWMFSNPVNTEMYITNTAGCASGGTWEPTAITKSGWNLSNSQAGGTATVYVKFRDSSLTETTCQSASIQWMVPQQMCTDVSSTATSGLMVDSGGPSSNYADSLNCSYAINTTGPVTFVINSMEIEKDWDFLTISNGVESYKLSGGTPSQDYYIDYYPASGPTTRTLHAYQSQPTITMTGSHFTVDFTSDSSVNLPGFNVAWKTNPSDPTLSLSPSYFLINSGASSTSSRNVSLAMSPGALAEMYITNTSNCGAGGTWESAATTKAWTLTAGAGTKDVSVKFRDDFQQESPCLAAQILFDPTLAYPIPSLTINGGAAGTNSANVTLTTATNGLPEMYISNTNNCGAGGTWEPASTTKAWTLSAGNGTKDVSIKFRDSSLQEYRCGSATIALDNTPPTPPILNFILLTDSLTSSPYVYFTAGSDPDTGIARHEIRILKVSDNSVAQDWTTINNSGQLTGLTLSSLVSYYFELRAVNGGGWTSSTVQSDAWAVRPVISIQPLGATALSENAGTVSFRIQSNMPVGANLSVPYVVSGEAVSGSDHDLSSGTATILSGQSSKTVSFQITDDAVAEDSERLRISLRNNDDAAFSLGPSLLEYLIKDNDGGSAPTVSSVTGGSSYSCAVINGGVQCWGSNDYGQLGDGTTTNRTSPVVAIPSGSGVTAVSTGSIHTCAVVNGGVKCWGSNGNYRLGDGTGTNRLTPVSIIASGSGVTAVAAGGGHTCAVINGGLQCWGWNGQGQLGDGTTTQRSTPVSIFASGSGVTAVAAGSDHTCVVINGGVQCWGVNYLGRLGDGTSTDRISPVTAIASGSGVTAVVAGSADTCALVSGGVQCWGQNNYGQIGDGTTTSALSPVSIIASGSGVTSIAAGGSHNCALMNGGVQCWGNNSSGQLGDGTTTQRPAPVSIFASGSGVTVIGAGSGHTCALVNGGLQCWGANSEGQVGIGTPSNKRSPVSVIAGGSGVSSVEAGEFFTCAGINGGAQCWGNNDFGQLGDGTTTNKFSPVSMIASSSGVTSVAVGTAHACALINGGVKCWGKNYNGQLGIGEWVDSHSPVSAIAAGSGVTAIAAGVKHTCAIVNGGVKCWGNNGYGQLGNGSTVPTNSPVSIIASGSGVTAIAVDEYHTCAVVNGGVQCWGGNSSGQLGDGTSIDRSLPVTAIASGSGVTGIATGANHTCAVVNGGVQCWGWNGSGQLGDGTTTQRLTPVTAIASGSGVTAIAAGSSHTCAVVNGGVKCWGQNYVGQIGDGTNVLGTASPASAIASGSGATVIAAGVDHTCAVVNGGVQCWGSDNAGQVGDGWRSLNPSWVTGLQP